jgi:hypothetical protein
VHLHAHEARPDQVDVVTTPSGDPQTFGLSLTGGPDAISQSLLARRL